MTEIKELELSYANRTILYAIERGFLIDKSGKVFGPEGNEKCLQLSNHGYQTFSLTVPKYLKARVRSIQVHRFQAYVKFGDKLFNTLMQVKK